jgi:hypothetical protein
MPRKFVLANVFLFAIAFLGGTLSVFGQSKFEPTHPKVEAMVRAALPSLRKHGSSSDRNCLAALAVVQASKRYDAEIPDRDPFVKKVVEEVRREVQGGRLLRHREVYYPCLALILLCEMGDVKYRTEIDALVDSLLQRQQKDGSFTYRGQDDWDTSQTQFVALAFFVARQHKISIPVESAKRILEFMLGAQKGQTWHYSPRIKKERISIHAACAGTVYLLGDLLQIQPRVKKVEKVRVEGLSADLPPSLSVYIPETVVTGEDENGGDDAAGWQGEGPLVNIDKRRLNEVKGKANRHFENAFTFSPPRWPFYYIYALERYAFFREQAEGNVGSGSMRNWYDVGVEQLAAIQKPNGQFPAGPEPVSVASVNTAFAVLFLVRSSQVLSLPPSSSSLTGGNDLASLKGQRLGELKRGKIQSTEASQNLNELLNSLNQDVSTEQLAALTESLKTAISDYQNRPETSRSEAQSFLRSLVKDKNYYKRLIAVKFLAAEQDLDNAPALIYAMGDPDVRVCVEAHNGLRLISRKIDSIQLPDKPNRSDLATAKQAWASWYTKLRPSAVLYD